jgi:long-chain acyl-CoA synthetase
MIHTHSLGRAGRYYGERTALASNGTRSTFRQLHDQVAAIAALLRGAGFEAGDRLALLLPNAPEYIELVYACAWLGVIAVPLNTRLSTAEIDHVLADASPRGLIRHSSMPVPTAQLSWQRVLDKEPFEIRNEAFHESGPESSPESVYDPNAVLALIYTSGTTGRPKGAVLTHKQLLANIHDINYWTPHKEGSVYLHAAPMFHIADFPMIFAAPALGSCQVSMPKFSPKSFCEAVEREGVRQTTLVPTMINLLTQFPDLHKYDLSSLEHLWYGGSPMAAELIHRTREVLPRVRLVQVYGLSETGFLTGLRDEEHTENRLMSCGRTCPGVDLKVVNESGKEVDAGVHGELVARGANVMPGYWNHSDEGAEVFRDGMFRTGDIGYRDADGYFYVLDRLKDMIVSGGENVYSGEVEAIIYANPAVQEAAVFGIPDPLWGELVTAVIVLKPGRALNADDLISHCRRSLANYKIPRRIEFSETELPKSGSGKILKRILRERYWVSQERAVA